MGKALFKGSDARLLAVGISLLAVPALILGCGSGTPSSTNAAATTSPAKSRETGPTEAVLHPVGASQASGRVVYVKKSPGEPLLKIRAEGLEPVAGERQYVIWQMASRHHMLSFATYYVGKDGRLSENLEPNPESLAFLEEGSTTQFLITKIDNDDALREAMWEAPNYLDPPFIGKRILQGTFTGPLVGAQG